MNVLESCQLSEGWIIQLMIRMRINADSLEKIMKHTQDFNIYICYV